MECCAELNVIVVSIFCRVLLHLLYKYHFQQVVSTLYLDCSEMSDMVNSRGCKNNPSQKYIRLLPGWRSRSYI